MNQVLKNLCILLCKLYLNLKSDLGKKGKALTPVTEKPRGTASDLA